MFAQLGFLVSLLVIAWSAAGCGSPWKRQLTSADEQVFLYKEYEMVDGHRVAKGFAHPAAVSPETLRVVLSRIASRHRPVLAAPTDVLVFRKDEVEKLAPLVSEALRELESEERVRFLVTRSSLASVFTGATGVSGVIFCRPEDTLHLAFDAIDQGIYEGDDGDPADVHFPYNPLEVTTGTPLVPFAGSALREGERGAVYPRWLEVDLRTVEAPAAGAPSPPPEERLGPMDVSPPSRTGEPEGVPPTEPALDEARYLEIRTKLETLKRLKEDGAISEEEYLRQFEEIMKDL